MKNIFSATATVHEKYDLKGSWVNRHAKLPHKGKRVSCRYCNDYFIVGSRDHCVQRPNRRCTPNVCFKDNDLNYKIILPAGQPQALYHQVLRDTAFLQEQRIMDYSLLMGVTRKRFHVLPTADRHATSFAAPPMSSFSSSASTASGQHHKNAHSEACSEEDGSSMLPPAFGTSEEEVHQHHHTPRLSRTDRATSQQVEFDADGALHASVVEGPGTYYMGIIDILQEWNFWKKCENLTKRVFRCQNGDGVSCIPPKPFAHRFMKRAVVEVIDGVRTFETPRDRSGRRSSAAEKVFSGRSNDRRFSAVNVVR
jgi:1-phosphatidylinositol-4-phosphate 5-kinase